MTDQPTDVARLIEEARKNADGLTYTLSSRRPNYISESVLSLRALATALQAAQESIAAKEKECERLKSSPNKHDLINLQEYNEAKNQAQEWMRQAHKAQAERDELKQRAESAERERDEARKERDEAITKLTKATKQMDAIYQASEKRADIEKQRADQAIRERDELRKALEFLHATFSKDIRQGYFTKDKRFVLDICGKAIAADADEKEDKS